MKRKEFLKSMFGLAIFPHISTAKNLDKAQYAHDDIFCRPYSNHLLIYFKTEHPVYKYLKSRLEGRIVNECQSGIPLPYRDFIFPVKEFYEIQDFEPLIILLCGRYSIHDKYVEEKHGFISFFHEKFNNIYVPNLILFRQ
jgi:hypothetical protein